MVSSSGVGTAALPVECHRSVVAPNGGAMGSHRANGRRARWLLGVLVGIGVWSIVVTPAIEGGVAQALPSTSDPQLTLNRLIRTSPFQGSPTSLRDNEGSAYVAGDNALWLASDNDNALFEVDRTTGALRRRSSPGSRCGRGGAARGGGRPTVASISRSDRPSAPMPSPRTGSGPRSRSRDSAASSASTSTT